MAEKSIRERLAAIETNTENLTKQVGQLDRKFDRFVERHDEKCPGRFSLGAMVALFVALIAILKSFFGKA
jgi:hypothetical protein